ncbi:hypothetical protein CDAR_611361 [Caerostris darwini]|uniref:Uncharacterized protein n=1 Tax=Caerostris darwini TaxID=1538125 RepID=A0AAV4UQG5_9ARAC|nr:hypothetical protein CDAR_611361 [Caerostris darwini]
MMGQLSATDSKGKFVKCRRRQGCFPPPPPLSRPKTEATVTRGVRDPEAFVIPNDTHEKEDRDDNLFLMDIAPSRVIVCGGANRRNRGPLNHGGMCELI